MEGNNNLLQAAKTRLAAITMYGSNLDAGVERSLRQLLDAVGWVEVAVERARLAAVIETAEWNLSRAREDMAALANLDPQSTDQESAR